MPKADPLMIVPLILKYNARETTIFFTKMNYLENLFCFSFRSHCIEDKGLISFEMPSNFFFIILFMNYVRHNTYQKQGLFYGVQGHNLFSAMSIIFLLSLVAIFPKIGNERRQCSGYLKNLRFISALEQISWFCFTLWVAWTQIFFFSSLFIKAMAGVLKRWEVRREEFSGPSPPCLLKLRLCLLPWT